ncbi:H/ACA ribonucleoprotein complex non-core subunit NAF1-like [Hibiscus syriacus]|uniref:H/ACA ribonucleoprotein complex non-core subunit NAF1-like n=1 Tax=Hibiscus syriacus TaxID=106335 RepID=UPI00192254E8|nr:H/ACA ribonucleoprotein complex non-core subunit NAF1-like [Hibiscus syriacus]
MFSINLNEWFDGYPNLDGIKLEESEFEDIESIVEICKEASFERTHVGDLGANGSEPDFDGFKSIVDGSAPVASESDRTVKLEEDESKPDVELGLSIEESKPEDFDVFKPTICGSEPVRGESGSTVKVEEEEFKPDGISSLPIEEVIGKVSLDDGLESGSSSSERKMKVEAVDGVDELEEGEILDSDEEVAVDGTTDEEEEEEETDDILSALDIELEEVDDEDAGASKGPIRSKNETEVLPPVPPLDVELQPHHQMLPVGVILSMVGTKVIVEGRDRHNPLNEGSILWISMNRSPLGFVDEIFGPVKNPYYIVRYNSESDVPAGIHEGISISFVPEFANHVLNDKNLHKKGYDASGENDEELSDDPEFSDDEKEAEYKRMQKRTKRGMNNQRVGNQKSNKKKVRSKNGVWKTDRNSAQQTSTTAMGQPPRNQNQHNLSTVSASLVNHNGSSTVVGQQNFVGGSDFVPPFPVMPPSSGIVAPSNGVWNNGMPVQHSQNTNFPNVFSAEGMSVLSQNYPQHPIPSPNPAISMPNMMSYQQQQFDPSLSTLANMVLPSGQSSLFAGPASAPWLGIAGQNSFNQSPFGMGMHAQQLFSALQGIVTNGPRVDGNCNLQPNGVQGNFESSHNFNIGAPSSRGRKPYHQGRGRGGRGHRRS